MGIHSVTIFLVTATLLIDLLAGIILGYFITRLLEREYSSSGKIIVNKSDGKTLYSLELDGNPKEIEFKKKIFFTVVVPSDEFHRD